MNTVNYNSKYVHEGVATSKHLPADTLKKKKSQKGKKGGPFFNPAHIINLTRSITAVSTDLNACSGTPDCMRTS